MKLTYFQLEPHLAKSLVPIYIVSGDEIVLKQDAIQLIRRAAKQAGFTDRSRISPESGVDGDTLYSLLYSPSLMGDKRLIEIDFRNSMPNKPASAILEDYANNPAPGLLILIDCNKLDDKAAKSTWYKAVEKCGVHLTIWPIPHDQLPKWIIQRAKKYKLTLKPEAATLIADYVEGNLIAAAQVLEKIYLLKPENVVDAALAESVLTNESRYTVFDFIDALIAGDSKRSLTILANLKFEGIEPVLILWAIIRELRIMADIGQKSRQGVSLDLLLQQHRIFARRQASVRRFLGKFNHETCWHLLEQAAILDKIIKGAVPGNVWESMQLFCLKMT